MRSIFSTLSLLILSLFAALIAGQAAAPTTTITTRATITVTRTLIHAAKTVTMTVSNSTVAYPTYASSHVATTLPGATGS